MGMMSLGSVGMAGMAVNEMNTMTGKIQKLETMIKSKADESEVRSLQDTLTSRVGKFIFFLQIWRDFSVTNYLAVKDLTFVIFIKFLVRLF